MWLLKAICHRDAQPVQSWQVTYCPAAGRWPHPVTALRMLNWNHVWIYTRNFYSENSHKSPTVAQNIKRYIFTVPYISVKVKPLLFSFCRSPACISKYSAGSVFFFPSFHHIHNPTQLEKFQRDLERYLTRKIGFEAVMRIRCTKGNWIWSSNALSWNFAGVSEIKFSVQLKDNTESSPPSSLPLCLRFIHPHIPRQLLCALHRPSVPG